MSIIDKICRMTDEFDILDMLQEECAEPIQAASKCKRVMKGDSSVDPRQARKSLIEEIGDVRNMLTLTMQKMLDADEINEMHLGKRKKMQRYYKRLKDGVT